MDQEYSNNSYRQGGYNSNRYNGQDNYSHGYRNQQRSTHQYQALDQEPSTDSFRKAFYTESEVNAAIPDNVIREFLQSNEIQIVSGSNSIRPAMSFAEAGFPNDILGKLERAGFEKPSCIQALAWPIIMSGNDLIGIAETGSGKTIAFLLPAVIHILDQPRIGFREGPIALVLAPTRELVEQIKDEAVKFCPKVRTAVCYGGTPRRQQLQALKYGVEIVVACPGRLIDFLDAGCLSLRRVTYLVLDEADRMLDMGFEPQIRQIIQKIRPDRQSLFFSATWPKEVRNLARDLCKSSPIHVQIGSSELKASSNITQNVFVVSEEEKHSRVLELLTRLQSEEQNQRIIVFCETKKSCDVFTRDLRRNHFPALSIHGDKDQDERRYVLEEFKAGRHNILCATDVASRGLDVKDVRAVVNYDMPLQIEDYVHRIGRTGRAGASGIAYSYFSEKNKALARDLVSILDEANQSVPQDLRSMVSHRGSGSFGNRRFGGGGFRRGDSYGGSSRGFGGGRGGYGSSRPHGGGGSRNFRGNDRSF